MALDKLVDSTQLDGAMTATANAIRGKTSGSALLTWDLTNGFKAAIESIPSGSGNLQAKTNINPSTSSQTITPDTGYDGLSSVQINAMPSGSATTPPTTITTNPTISVNETGQITATNSKTQSVTPTVSAGYVSAGTAGTITVSGSNTSQLVIQTARTFIPSTTDQTIGSGKYLTGVQTIKGDANLVPGNIKSGTTIFGVQGTYSGGGGGGYKHAHFEWDGTCFSFSSGDTITVQEETGIGCFGIGYGLDESWAYPVYFTYAAEINEFEICCAEIRGQSAIMLDNDYDGTTILSGGLSLGVGVFDLYYPV